MAEHRDFTWNRLSTRLNLRLAIGVLAVVALVAALGGYVVGTNRSGVSIHTGKAHSVQAQISITGEDGWVTTFHWTCFGPTPAASGAKAIDRSVFRLTEIWQRP